MLTLPSPHSNCGLEGRGSPPTPDNYKLLDRISASASLDLKARL